MSETVVPEGMFTLAHLRDQATEDASKRKVLLILHPGNRCHNATFLDPALGVLEVDQFPGKAFYCRDLNPHDTVGIFVD